MSVTRTSKARLVLGRGLIAMLAVATLAGAGTAAEDSSFLSQFHSFVPARPMAEQAPQPKRNSPAEKAMLKGLIAYRSQGYANAAADFEKAIKGGEPLAGWYLGEMYRMGRGVSADPATAISYYQRVASTYDPYETRPQVLSLCVDAIARLGDYYRDGAPGVLAPDPQRAYQLYSLAASHGHPGAQYGLATMYLKGLGLNRNPGQGVKWLKLAASKRYVPAQLLLGDVYWEGTIVRRDPARAIMWYTLAEQTAQPDAQPQIDSRLKSLVQQASLSQRQLGEAKAAKWTRANGYAPDTPVPSDAQ